MIVSKEDLKKLTKSYVKAFRPHWSAKTIEDIAKSFVQDDFPLNNVKTKSEALWVLDNALRS